MLCQKTGAPSETHELRTASPVRFAKRSRSLLVWNWITLDTIISLSHHDIQLALWQELLESQRARWGTRYAVAICNMNVNMSELWSQVTEQESKGRATQTAKSFSLANLSAVVTAKCRFVSPCVMALNPLLYTWVKKQKALTAWEIYLKSRQ